MNSLAVSFILGVFCVSLSTSMKDPTCRGQKMEVAEPDMQVWKDCLKEIAPEINTEDDQAKIEKKIPKEKMACLGKCFMMKEGLVDDKGMPSKDMMMTKINATMPMEVMEEMDSAMGKCVDETGKGVDPNDPTCMTYQPLTQCMMVAFMEICKLKD
ncbi:uncharacterized protein LOC110854246 [Folsomia candida]|uniref:Uncharacterized protein n=1 Tax=Folsomia candida TaxID=158441 RepID=A0A226DXH4_FOLCA|nr:uncharacterized protein LOC110854246 [Folsomia candida]OXA49973.1 hypothetical protein Fcan01_14777 [Folsomia candida]